MSKKSKAKKYLERLMAERRRESVDVAALKDAAFYYWKNDIPKCCAIFFPLMERIIVEPLKGTKEYTDGERKQETQIEQQQEESATEEVSLETFGGLFEFPIRSSKENSDETEAERDDDGYLIR